MLLKNEIIGTLETVGPIKDSRSGSKYQEISIRVHAPRDGAGMAIGEDEIFPIMIFKEEKIKETWTTLGATGLGTKVKASVYLNSQAREAGGVIFHNLSLKLKTLAAL